MKMNTIHQMVRNKNKSVLYNHRHLLSAKMLLAEKQLKDVELEFLFPIEDLAIIMARYQLLPPDILEEIFQRCLSSSRKYEYVKALCFNPFLTSDNILQLANIDDCEYIMDIWIFNP